MGDGVIDGRGWAKLIGKNVSWWDLAEQARAGGSQNCPRLMVLSRCDNFTLYRITLKIPAISTSPIAAETDSRSGA